MPIFAQKNLALNSSDGYKLNNDRLYRLIENDSISRATLLLNETLLYAKSNNLPNLEAQAYNGLGTVFSKMGSYNNAEIYFKKSLDLLDTLNDNTQKSFTLYCLTKSYLKEKAFTKFDSIYPIALKLSENTNSILEIENLSNNVDKHYYLRQNAILKTLIKELNNKLENTDFTALSYPRTYPKTYKRKLKAQLQYYNAMAETRMRKHDPDGYKLLFSLNEDSLKNILGDDMEAYRKLGTFNYYKYLYYTNVNKRLDSANKYLLKADKHKYTALKKFELENDKNGELIHQVLKDQEQLKLVQEINKRESKISKAYSTITFISLLALGLSLILFYSYYRNRQKVIKINHELKNTNEKLKEIDKDRLEFFSILSHELRTPIYGITGLANLMQQEPKSEKRESYLNSLISSSNYISVLIDNVLQASKLRFEEKKLKLEPGKINAIVQNVLATVKTAANDKGLELKSNIDESILNQYVLIDKVAFNQILINLVYNAIRYTKTGYIAINVKEESKTASHLKLHFEIEDTGIGIKEEHRDTVFHAFENKLFLEKNSSGSGLGLNIVKTLLKSYKTDIDFKSEVGKGTTFFFTVDFKLCKAPPEIPMLKSSKNIKQHALVVDDNKINLLITKKNIERISGYTCDTVTNGKEAITLLQQNAYDIIFLDINMPEMDGYQVSQHIRNLNITTPIIALTALNSNQVTEKVIASGMNQVITKPYSFNDFKKIILEYTKNNFAKY